MELSWMRYFAEVAKTKSMTKAASNLFVSQPALSKTITLLEKELGACLFERTGRGMNLTECGEVYYEAVKNILQDIESAKHKVWDMCNLSEHVVKIIVAVYSKRVIDIILEFRRMHPNIHIIIENPGEQSENLRAEKFDFALVAAPYKMDKYKGTFLYEDEQVLEAAPHLEIAQKDHVDLIECRNYPFIFPSRIEENQDCDLFCDMAKVQEALCVYSGFMPKGIAYTNNIETTTTCLLAYDAVTIMPKGFYESRYSDQFKSITIDSPECGRKIYLVQKNKKYLSESARLLKQYVCEQLAEAEK